MVVRRTSVRVCQTHAAQACAGTRTCLQLRRRQELHRRVCQKGWCAKSVNHRSCHRIDDGRDDAGMSGVSADTGCTCQNV